LGMGQRFIFEVILIKRLKNKNNGIILM